MREADEERTFFKEFRFYPVIAISASFEVRVYRGERLRKGRTQSHYPLGYAFDDLITLKRLYTKAEALRVIKNILFEYGIKNLLPILKNAVKVVLQKRQQGMSSPSTQASTTQLYDDEVSSQSYGKME